MARHAILLNEKEMRLKRPIIVRDDEGGTPCTETRLRAQTGGLWAAGHRLRFHALALYHDLFVEQAVLDPLSSGTLELDMKYVVKRDASHFWYWLFYAANGEAISRSSESYVNKANCLRSIEINKGSASAPVIDG